MAKGKYLLGCDIGSNAVKICLLRERKAKTELVVFDSITYPEDTVVETSLLNRNAVIEANTYPAHDGRRARRQSPL